MVRLFNHSKTGTILHSKDEHQNNDKTKQDKNANEKNTNESEDHLSKHVTTGDKSSDKENQIEGGKNDQSKEERNAALKSSTAIAKPRIKHSEYPPDSETLINTRLNALLYHTKDETVDLYKQENNASDLLGRLYYDDYDSDSSSPTIGSDSSTPMLPSSASDRMGPSSGYFQSKLAIASASSPSISSLIAARSPSSQSLQRPEMNRIKSFERGISFQTETDNHGRSLTLKVKHPNFKFRRNNKTFLAGFNDNQESLRAIEWLFEEMVINGDTIIILQVLDEKSHDTIDNVEAGKILSRIELLNKHFRKVAIVFETVIGKPQKLLKRAIDEFKPAMMIIGTHHHDDPSYLSHRFLAKSSMSKYFLECALVPVIVVKTTYKYNETLSKEIDSPSYFHDWLANINISSTFSKEKSRRSKLRSLSPSPSRTSSLKDIRAMSNKGNTEDLLQERGRRSHKEENDRFRFLLSPSSSRSRSTSSSRPVSNGLAKFFSSH
ncbi:uncharacterized protein PRCAT00002446001 [Priceomyces carsonii]|uniref:uncharacterized protein n=1 Tax=Priceomyces carsonii TaxID=28549 RepID=UPI002EDB0C52|nr:unnamed protein product [Priceomyces carsonii]